MTIHVKVSHNATALGRIGFNMDEIHSIARVLAVSALILSAIALYQNRRGQKASIEDLALFLGTWAFFQSGTYL